MSSSISAFGTVYLETPRTVLRQWQLSDLEPWVAMNADPEVMRYLQNPLTREEAIGMAERIHSKIEENSWGLYALEIKESGAFAGFVGLSHQDPGQSFSPCIEVGWRLAQKFWGYGYATEAASAALEHGLTMFPEIFSFTARTNVRSQEVMKRIGLVERPELAFDHPRVTKPELISHVVYSKRKN